MKDKTEEYKAQFIKENKQLLSTNINYQKLDNLFEDWLIGKIESMKCCGNCDIREKGSIVLPTPCTDCFRGDWNTKTKNDKWQPKEKL